MHIGLCEGQHQMTQNNGEALDGFIFSRVESPLNFDSHSNHVHDWLNNNKEELEWGDVETLHLYVTGLTPLLTAFLKIWMGMYLHSADRKKMMVGGCLPRLVLMHYDRVNGIYLPQSYSE